jgi:hypothetical protein
MTVARQESKWRLLSVQLDVLRGIAILLMIINHVGVSLVDPNREKFHLVSTLTFIGSFAPVIFFFTTGFGLGISQRDRSWAGFGSTLLKAGLLVVADQFMFWKSGRPYGLDFLGFIGLCSVLVTVVSKSTKPLLLCFSLIFGLLLCRFALGPSLRDHFQLPPILAWLLGVRALDYVSYPLAPWLLYPLLGFVIARRDVTAAVTTPDGRWGWIAFLGCSVLSVVMYRAQVIFFRWGTMNFAFFVLSIALGIFFLATARQIGARWPRAARLVSVRGIVSFAVVPIHYGLIELCTAWGFAHDGYVLLVVMFVIAMLSIMLSRIYAGAVNVTTARARPPIVWASMSALILLCAAILWLGPRQANLTPGALFSAFVIGQLAVAGLLSVRSQRRDWLRQSTSRFERTQSN